MISEHHRDDERAVVLGGALGVVLLRRVAADQRVRAGTACTAAQPRTVSLASSLSAAPQDGVDADPSVHDERRPRPGRPDAVTRDGRADAFVPFGRRG